MDPMMNNGLLAGKSPQAGGAPPEMASAGAESETAEGGSNVTAEEQAQYDQFVNNAFRLVYRSPESINAVLKGIEGGGDPVGGLANTAVMVVAKLNESATKAGSKISDDVLFHGGVEILEDLANTAEKAGIHSFTEKELEAATLRAMDIGREVLADQGRVNKDALKQEFGQIVQADRQGQLAKMLPGIDKFSAETGDE